MRTDGYFDNVGCPRVRIEAATGQFFDAVVNTAFTGEFWMPKNILMALGFVLRGSINVEHADGTIKPAQLFAGHIIWFGQKLRVSAVASDDQSSYLGMALLRQVSLRIQPNKNLVYLEAPFAASGTQPKVK